MAVLNQFIDLSVSEEGKPMLVKKLLLIATAVLVILVAGCHKLVGGGWFPGLFGGKAIFGFNAQCYAGDEGGEGIYWYRGQFQFMDKSANARFHGDIDWQLGLLGEGLDCENESSTGAIYPPNAGEFSGICWSQPGKIEGTFWVYVEDNGQPGLVGDFIHVEATCVEGGSYVHEGLLGGGNIMAVGHHD